MNKAQVVLIKSCQGFCDRLRVLNQALLYCLKYGAVLSVDWEDSAWDLPFESIFALKGVPYCRPSKVVAMIKGGDSCAWTWKEAQTPMTTLVARNVKYKGMKYRGGFCNTDADVRMRNAPPDDEILVSNGYGLALNEYKLLCLTLRFKEDVRQILISRLEAMPDKYVMVHLRGTDRYKEEFLDLMISNMKQMSFHDPIYVIGDDARMIHKWLSEFPDHKLFNPSASALTLSGALHLQTADVLKEKGLSKREMHIEMLCDFFALIKATERIGMKESYFYDTACRLGECYWEQMVWGDDFHKTIQ